MFCFCPIFHQGSGLRHTGVEHYRQEGIQAIMAAMGTEGGDALATFRALGSYIIAADLVGIPPAENQDLRG